MTAGQFLNCLAEGYRRTPLDDLLFFLFLAVILLLVVAWFVAQRVSKRRELARRSREILRHLAGRIDLGREEAALLVRLVRYLRADQPTRALFRDHRVFDACARSMARVQRVPGDTLNALRLKMGFQITQPGETPASTAEIPEGSTIILVTANGKRARGKLRAKGQGSLLIQFERADLALKPNVRSTAWFHNAGGIYSFPTRITTVLPDGVRIDQSAKVVRHQRRRYHRRKVSLPVFVRPAASGGEFTETVLVDLSGGGASIRWSKRPPKPGESLEITFSPSGEALTVAARVVRVTPPGSILHVEFESLGETERARIMGIQKKPA